METHNHRRLKERASTFLIELGAAIVAREVACPISRYRVDVASYIDRVAPHADPKLAEASTTLWRDESNPEEVKSRTVARTVFVECKQSRADFLRDVADHESLLEQRDALRARRASIESTIVREREPHLRESGTFLFHQMEDWAYESSRSGPYRRVMRELRRVEKRLYGQTKFALIARYRLADRLYICAPRGLIKPRELPDGWGLLEVHRRALKDLPVEHPVTVRVRATETPSPQRFRDRTLRNIAAALTREAMSEACAVT